jgi:hypothetical protein
MLPPETRTLLTDALRPPDGFRLDVAVATTYSLDLHALLLAPLSFALQDIEAPDLDRVDPIKLLEAIRRYATHTTVFCQAGAIHVPAGYRRILTFAESCVRQVTPPNKGRVFHPKIWVLRFHDANDRPRHRFLCLSRNLTFDRSWDTLLRLDETDDMTRTAPDTQPLADFVATLPGLCVTGLEPTRTASVKSLAESLRDARFEPPAGATQVQFLPLGLTSTPAWPLPDSVERLLAISAFLDLPTVQRLQRTAKHVTLVSRQESLDKLAGLGQLGADLFTLQRCAEVEVGEDISKPIPLRNEASDAPEGLHAKTFIADLRGRGLVLTGSANATSAGFGGNVEFDVLLEGPIKTCGVGATWEGRSAEAPGLAQLCESYTPAGVTDEEAANAAQEWEIDQFHTELAAIPLRLLVETAGDGRYGLSLEGISRASPGRSTIWPLSLPRQMAQQALDPSPRWAPIGLASITPFLVVETTVRHGAAAVRRSTVIKATLVGDPPERAQEALRDMLTNRRDVLRYLVFLLGDPAYDDFFGTGEGADERWVFGAPSVAFGELALFEPLVKAAARGDDALERVANLVDELRAMKNGDELIPDGFDSIWPAVWSAYGKAAR